MRDRTRLRGHATEEFRREQLLRREFGLQRRYAHKAIRRYGSVRAAADAIRARVEELVPSPSPSPSLSPSTEPGPVGQSVPIAAVPATAAAEPVEAEVVDVARAELEPDRAEPPRAEPLSAEPIVTELASSELARVESVAAEPPRAESLGTEPVVTELAKAEPVAAEPVDGGPQAREVGGAEPRPARSPAASQPVPLAPVGRRQSRPGRGPTRSTMRPASRRAVRHGRQRRHNGCRHGEKGQVAFPASTGRVEPRTPVQVTSRTTTACHVVSRSLNAHPNAGNVGPFRRLSRLLEAAPP
jgi:hypothetical protein